MTDPLDRAAKALRTFVREEDSARTFGHVYEYAVVSATASTLDLSPTDPDVAPQLPTAVTYRPSLAGSSSVPIAGSLAIVAFINGDPARPFVLALDSNAPSAATVDATGTVSIGPSASAVKVGQTFTPANAAAAVGHFVRYGDTVTVGTGAGVVTWTAGTVSGGET